MTKFLKAVATIVKILVLLWLGATTVGIGVCDLSAAAGLLSSPGNFFVAGTWLVILLGLALLAGFGAVTYQVWKWLRKDFGAVDGDPADTKAEVEE
jgi:hypothetical protein